MRDYGGNARYALPVWAFPNSNRTQLLQYLHVTPPDPLTRLAYSLTAPLYSYVENELSTHLFYIEPCLDRSSTTITFASSHISEIVQAAAREVFEENVHEFLQIFLQQPRLRGAAGYILGAHFHDLLARGGEWELLRLAQNLPGKTNNHYHTPDPEQISYLQLGHPDSLARISQQKATVDLSKQYKAFPYTSFDKNTEPATLTTGYYRPLKPNMPNFDAFIFPAESGTALILQATLSDSEQHFMKKNELGIAAAAICECAAWRSSNTSR